MKSQEEETKFFYFSKISEILNLVPSNDQGIPFLLLPDGKVVVTSSIAFDTADKTSGILLDLGKKRLQKEYTEYYMNKHGAHPLTKASVLAKRKGGWVVQIDEEIQADENDIVKKKGDNYELAE